MLLEEYFAAQLEDSTPSIEGHVLLFYMEACDIINVCGEQETKITVKNIRHEHLHTLTNMQFMHMVGSIPVFTRDAMLTI